MLFSNPMAASIMGTDEHVVYACDCHEMKPISKLYFCRHCTKLRCAKCVTHEVDSFYCPNCLENMPSAEAKLKKNRCANCFDCPSCGHTLSVRATAVSAASVQDGTSPAKKMHYLNCGFCRWTTRDIGLPDQPTPTGGWGAVEKPFSKKLHALLEYYKQLTHQEKIEREREKLSKRRTNLYLLDRHGYALSVGKKKSISSATISSALLARTSSSTSPSKEAVAPVLVESLTDIPPIDESYYTEPVLLEKKLSLEQSLRAPGRQASDVDYLYPKQKHLMVRRSQRCKECEHNLCKPEFNPSSTKFKIQLGGLQYCPMMQIQKKVSLFHEEESEVILSITNPLDTVMTVTFSSEVSEEESTTTTGEISLPSVELPISAKDATIEFDGIGAVSSDEFQDDPQVVFARSSNKLSIYAKVKPKVASGDVVVAFNLSYEYKMITTPLLLKPGGEGGEKPPQEIPVKLSTHVRINFGAVKTLQ